MYYPNVHVTMYKKSFKMLLFPLKWKSFEIKIVGRFTSTVYLQQLITENCGVIWKITLTNKECSYGYMGITAIRIGNNCFIRREISSVELPWQYHVFMEVMVTK